MKLLEITILHCLQFKNSTLLYILNRFHILYCIDRNCLLIQSLNILNSRYRVFSGETQRRALSCQTIINLNQTANFLHEKTLY